MNPDNKKAPSREEISSYIYDLFGLFVNAKLVHWQTRKYALHKAIDFLAELLPTLIDTFVEISLGEKEFSFPQGSLSVGNVPVTNADIINYADNLVKHTYYIRSQYKDDSITNILDDINNHLNHFIYLARFE